MGGFVLDFDATNQILRVTLEGVVTDDVLTTSYAAVSRYYTSHALCPCIVDLSQATKFALSSAAIMRLAASPPALPAGHPRVLVAHTDFSYGMARMFQILGERSRPDLRVVRTLDEAYRILDVKAPEFGPLPNE